ncbi:MAG TPA: hypothetical protein VJ935_03560 [Acidimicrobiia bacterium]|nr:hypothetical protein [Acidimicrobiia bacterium]
MDRAQAGSKVFGQAVTPLKRLWEELDAILTEAGLTRDVKTIYVSYTSQGLNVVAAAHPGADYLELALALPADFDHPDLVDAVHLKWRTLPIAVHLTPDQGIPSYLPKLVKDAITAAPHIEPRAVEDFKRYESRRTRRGS